jgi:Fe-S cluster biosynthesis and repair protein YggX
MITCTRCGQQSEATAPARRVTFAGPVKEKIVSQICAACWKEWEGMEVKVINEYRLNFMDPQHREMVKKSCLEFLKLPAEA